MLKLEHSFKEAIFVSPKLYFLELGDGSTITKCKGYSGKLDKSQYLSLLKENTLDLQVTRWVRSLKGGSIEIKEFPYKLRPVFNKRQKEFDNNGAWVNTKPINLGLS